MPKSHDAQWGRIALGVVALVVIVAIGVDLRLDEVTASPSLPAEDPYTHTALVREHLRDGNVGPLSEGATLYPSGMHAFVAALYAFTGADIVELMRFLPVLFGAIGIAGVGLLLWRYEGTLAAVVGALAYAIAPEVVFRTTMMAPTALDLAVLPFFLYATLNLVQGRLGWAAPSAATALFLVFAHPWVLSIVALAGFVFLVASVVSPWPASRGRPMHPTGLGAAIAIVGVSWAMSLWGCFGTCGEGLAVVFQGGGRLDVLAPIIAGVALLVAAGLAAARGGFARFLSRQGSETPSWAPRIAASVVLAVALVVVAVIAAQGGYPEHVNLPRMLGWPVLLLAGLGFVILPLVPGPAALIGGAVAATTYPFVVFDPFNSPFWSHRTAVYLGLGLVLLVGVATRALLVVGQAVRTRIAESESADAARSMQAGSAVGVAVALLVLIPVAGAVYVGTPDTYPDGWYRLYDDCGLTGLREIADEASADPEMIIMTGSWQSKLVLAAYTDNASRVWYEEAFYTSSERRTELASWMQDSNRTLIVVVDRYLFDTHPGLDVSYLEDPPWTPMGTWCDDAVIPLRAYQTQGGGA